MSRTSKVLRAADIEAHGRTLAESERRRIREFSVTCVKGSFPGVGGGEQGTRRCSERAERSSRGCKDERNLGGRTSPEGMEDDQRDLNKLKRSEFGVVRKTIGREDERPDKLRKPHKLSMNFLQIPSEDSSAQMPLEYCARGETVGLCGGRVILVSSIIAYHISQRETDTLYTTHLW